MSDPIYEAMINNEKELDRAMQAVRLRLACSPPPSLRCINCEAPLPQPGRFCDEECREDYERRHK